MAFRARERFFDSRLSVPCLPVAVLRLKCALQGRSAVCSMDGWERNRSTAGGVGGAERGQAPRTLASPELDEPAGWTWNLYWALCAGSVLISCSSYSIN